MAIRRVEKIDSLVPVKHAFMSVFDKTGLGLLATRLVETCPGIMIYSTGGTYKKLVEVLGNAAEQHVQEVKAYTGLPETEGGLVKSLHHKLFLGYLTETYCEGHQRDLQREGAVPIDLLVGNLYPFEKVVEAEGINIEDARGNIDVGGPSALRAAAKNWHRVAAVVDPNDYGMLMRELRGRDGCTTLRTRFELHKKAFRLLADYNTAIADFVESVPFVNVVDSYEIVNPMRGE